MMRSRVACLLIACLHFVSAPAASAQKFSPEDLAELAQRREAPLFLLRTQIEFIEVPHATLTRLLAEPRTSGHDADLRAKVQSLVEGDEATVVETLVCTGRGNHVVQARTGMELVYPTDYARPGEPTSAGAEETAEATRTDRPHPTDFDTRELGSKMRLEPVVDPTGEVIDLRIECESVHHVKNEMWAEWKDSLGDASVRMPALYSVNVDTSVTLLAGKPLMVAAVSPEAQDGKPDTSRKLMIFVRCHVLKVMD